MAKDAKELWQTKLRILQDRLEVGARRHPGLRSVLLQVGPEGRSHLKENPRGVQNRIVGRSRAGPYDRNSSERCPWRLRYFVGTRSAANRFNRLAAEAGDVLSTVPPDILRGVALASRRAISPAKRWIWCVFDLGWQHVPHSNLRAFKYVWGYEHEGIKTFPYERTQLQALVEAFDNPPSFLRSWVDEKPPDRFFSELENAFLASLHAIDTLFNRVQIEVPTSSDPGRHRKNIQLGECPDWLFALGWEIHGLVQYPKVMERFRARTREWMDERRAELKDQATWQQRREVHEAWIHVEDRLRKEAAGPPGPGWEFDACIRHDYRATENGLERNWDMVFGWFPPGLVAICEPEPQLPLSAPDRVLSLSEKYALLGGIHDRCCKAVEPIDPWWPHSSLAESFAEMNGSPDHFDESLIYTILACTLIPKLDEKRDRKVIEALLADVRDDLEIVRGRTHSHGNLVQEPPDAGQPADTQDQPPPARHSLDDSKPQPVQSPGRVATEADPAAVVLAPSHDRRGGRPTTSRCRMTSKQPDDLTLGCSCAEARSQLTRLIAEGFQLHGALQKDYETKFSAGTWDRQDGASALKERLEYWCNNTVKSVLSSIFPTRAEWNQLTTVERPWVASGSALKGDCNVEGSLQHFARMMKELTAIRDSQLASYDPPNKVVRDTLQTLAGLVPDVPEQNGEEPTWKRLHIEENDHGDNIVQLDGKEYRLPGEAATKLLGALKDAKGRLVLGTTLGIVIGDRADRAWKALPEGLRDIIEPPGRGRKGYRMK